MSSVKTFEQCGLKAKYRYVDRIPEPRSESAHRGIQWHADIERFLRGERTNLPEGLDYYQQWLTEVKNHEFYPEHTVKLSKDWKPVETGHWYKGIFDLKIVSRTESRVKELKCEVSGKEVGYSQFDSPEAYEVIVYDWKTGKIYPEHHDQRTLYSVAAFAEHPTVFQVRAIHVYLDLRKLREETFHRDQMYELRKSWEDRANRFFNALQNHDWLIANPGFHCRFCPYSKAKGGPCRF